MIGVTRWIALCSLATLAVVATDGRSVRAADSSRSTIILPKARPRPVSRPLGGVRLVEALRLYQAKQYQAAALSLERHLGSGQLASKRERDATLYYLSKALFRLRLYYSCAPYLEQLILESEGGGRYQVLALKMLTWVSHRLDDESMLYRVAREMSASRFPSRLVNEFNFLSAKQKLLNGDPAGAIQRAREVSPESRYYPRAKMLEADALLKTNQTKEAIRSYLAMLTSRVGTESLTELKMIALLNLGRLYYELGEFDKAYVAFRRVPIESISWDRSHFEMAWPLFMMEKYHRALGNLHSYLAPQLDHIFIPEVDVLKGTIFFRLCRYEDSELALEHFFELYGPVLERLRKVESRPAKNVEALYRPFVIDWLARAETQTTSGKKKRTELAAQIKDRLALVPEPILRHLRADPQVVDAIRKLSRISREVSWIRKSDRYFLGDSVASGFSKSALATALRRVLLLERQRLLRDGGQWLRGEMTRFREQLESLTYQARIVYYEMANGDKEREANRSGAIEPSYREQEINVVEKDDFEYWPFNGEYWPDEVGYYRYLVRGACR